MRTTVHNRGFTLLELLVALAIFALVAVMAYGGLRSVLDADRAVERQGKRLAELQSALLFIERDIAQVVDRGIRDELGDSRPALLGGLDRPLELTRGGRSNPGGLARSDLQRIAYGVEDDALVRLSWRVLDRAQDSQPDRLRLAGQVRGLRLRFLDANREWSDVWPPASGAAGLPLALELTLELEDWGAIQRLFQLPRG